MSFDEWIGKQPWSAGLMGGVRYGEDVVRAAWERGRKAAIEEVAASVEDAPHADHCGAPSSSGSQVFKCRCWKAEAEEALERIK